MDMYIWLYACCITEECVAGFWNYPFLLRPIVAIRMSAAIIPTSSRIAITIRF